MAFPPFRSACFFSTDNGATVQRRASAAEESAPGFSLPSGVTNLYRFDEEPVNNKALSTLWESNASAFTMSGNQVLVNGQAASFDEPGLVFVALQNATALWSKAQNTSDAFTREEYAQMLALGFRALGYL